jgi:hypothetical protein
MGKISTAEVLRLRATSVVSRDKSVGRCAQDDVFAGVLKKNIPNKLALMGGSPGSACIIEKSRKVCPELVERGRLKKLIETWS